MVFDDCQPLFLTISDHGFKLILITGASTSISTSPQNLPRLWQYDNITAACMPTSASDALTFINFEAMATYFPSKSDPDLLTSLKLAMHDIYTDEIQHRRLLTSSATQHRRLLNIVGYSTSSVIQHRQPCPQSTKEDK
jgi:hypothetical protein